MNDKKRFQRLFFTKSLKVNEIFVGRGLINEILDSHFYILNKNL